MLTWKISADKRCLQASNLTSQNPLQPIKRPTPYVKTDYAEIAHFMKVEPNGMQASDANACKGWDEDRETIM